MKRAIAIILLFTLLMSGCGKAVTEITPQKVEDTQTDSIVVNESENTIIEDTGVGEDIDTKEPTNIEIDENDGLGDISYEFSGLNDPDLLQYLQDDIYAELNAEFGDDECIIEGIDTVFISKEYLEEAEYNSKKNIYFGYSLEELDNQFQGTRYVFTLGEDGRTTVEPFEDYDDTYEQVIKNVAIGSGVILICVTVSIATAGTGAPACVSMVFAAAAKTGATCALSSGVLGSVAAGTITAIKTGNREEALKSAAIKGSEGFKWGAITGVIAGGSGEALKLVKSAKTIHSPRESELTVLERTKGATEQVSYLDGKEVPLFTEGATRPDVVVKNTDGTIQAIEVKNYNLESVRSRWGLYKELRRQVTNRASHLPAGSTQKVVLDVRGRGFSKELTDMVIRNIQLYCSDSYPNLPVELLTY